MIDALLRLLQERDTCCRFYSIITGDMNGEDNSFSPASEEQELTLDSEASPEGIRSLNSSQQTAVRSCDGPLSLIWGPPGRLSL